MKQSEIIMQESLCEESDWKAWSLHFKALREEKWEFFVERLLPEIKDSPHVVTVVQHQHHFKITFTSGVIADYYPKKDRIMFTKQAKWMWNGFGELEKMI